MEKGQFTVAEMLADIHELNNSYENSVKKTIAAKYGIDSKKTAEIIRQILVKASELRHFKKNYDEKDIEAFRMLTNMPEIYSKVEEWLKAEPEGFVKFLKDYYEKTIKDAGLEKYMSWKPSDLKYQRVPYGKIYSIKFYQFLVRFLEENGSDNAEKRDARQEAVDLVINKLNEQLESFKQKLLDRAEEQALAFYDTIIEKLDDWKKEAAKWKKLYTGFPDKWYNEKRAGYYWSSEEYKNIERTQHMWAAKVANAKRIKTNYSKEQYGKYCREEAEKEYEMKKHTMAEKIVDRNFDYANIKFTAVKEDPKWIEMMITDGVKKVYARSIIAAEFSEKVTVHFRFILTDRK